MKNNYSAEPHVMQDLTKRQRSVFTITIRYITISYRNKQV